MELTDVVAESTVGATGTRVLSVSEMDTVPYRGWLGEPLTFCSLPLVTHFSWMRALCSFRHLTLWALCSILGSLWSCVAGVQPLRM